MSNAQMNFDPVTLAEALSSRIAHEMAGPVGAVSNGIELMRELGADAGDDVSALIDTSAKTAGARLQFYRLAYGRAGFENSSIAQFRSAATAFLSGNDAHTLSWPLPPVLPTLSDGQGRIGLILIEIAQASLIRGGNISVTVAEDSFQVTARGDDSNLPDSVGAILSKDHDTVEITPTNVHAALARLFADAIGWTIAVDLRPGQAGFAVSQATGWEFS